MMDDLDRRILDEIQSGFPLETRPFCALADRLNLEEEDILERVRHMAEEGLIRDIGPVFDPARLGCVTTLCAAKVRPEDLPDVAGFVSSFPEVTHNYERDHEYNLWFTLIAHNQARIDSILDMVRRRGGVRAIRNLPALRKFKVQVEFKTGDADP